LIAFVRGPLPNESKAKHAAALHTTMSSSAQWNERGNSTRPSSSNQKPDGTKRKYSENDESTVSASMSIAGKGSACVGCAPAGALTVRVHRPAVRRADGEDRRDDNVLEARHEEERRVLRVDDVERVRVDDWRPVPGRAVSRAPAPESAPLTTAERA
jgi:hypothetical protein